MNRIIIIPDTNATVAKNNDSYKYVVILLTLVAVGGVAVTLGDRMINKSWWWKRLTYENNLREAEGLPKKSIFYEISGLFRNKSNGW